MCFSVEIVHASCEGLKIKIQVLMQKTHVPCHPAHFSTDISIQTFSKGYFCCFFLTLPTLRIWYQLWKCLSKANNLDCFAFVKWLFATVTDVCSHLFCSNDAFLLCDEGGKKKKKKKWKEKCSNPDIGFQLCGTMKSNRKSEKLYVMWEETG